MHNLHPGCIFGHVNGVLRICTGCKFAHTFEVEQIYLHPGANCAYARKMCIFYSFRSAILIYCRRFCLKRYLKLFYQNEKADCLSWLTRHQNKCAYINASTILIQLNLYGYRRSPHPTPQQIWEISKAPKAQKRNPSKAVSHILPLLTWSISSL